MSGIALAVACTFSFAAPDPAAAKSPAKSVQTEAIFVSYDAAAKTVTAKVKKPGSGKAAKMLKKNKEATWAVKPEGSVLTRTTVAVNGVKGEIFEISKGKTVNIYWRPDEADPTILRARKIDVIMSQADFDAKYGTD
jgi:hypothetical protein